MPSVNNTDKNKLRETLLAEWITNTFPEFESGQLQLKPISGDAGFRRYYRFAEPSKWLAVDAPPTTEDSRQFIELATVLHLQGVTSPRILAADIETGFLLVEDFGDELLFSHRQTAAVADLYKQAFSTLLNIQLCPDRGDLLPRYDQTLLRRELSLFREWFVEKLLGYSPAQAEIDLLLQFFSFLESSALKQPQSFVHRDYHSRNLIVRCGAPMGVIDFQGAVWGPCTYDVVSLLRDCYVRFPSHQVKACALSYKSLATQAGLLPNSLSEKQYLHWFDWMGLQRHIKVLGIFSRLYLRDNKDNYLKDLPLVVHYTLEIADLYPELQPFSHWFRERLLPLITQQSWYKDTTTTGANL